MPHTLLPVMPLLLTAFAAAQEARPTLPSDLAELATRVEKAHHPEAKPAPVTAFRASFELMLLDTAADQGGQVDLAVQFLVWRRADGKVRPLIRYEVKEAGSPIVRGQDREGPWQLDHGKAIDLNGPESTQDLAACRRDTSFARQLLRCLEPGDVLRGLERPEPVREGVLTVQRGKSVPCLIASGDLATFPLLRTADPNGPVHVAVAIERDTGRLLAVDAWPTENGKPVEAAGERVLFTDLHVRDGFLVPRRIEHMFVAADGQLAPHSRINITALELRPELRAEDLDRPL